MNITEAWSEWKRRFPNDLVIIGGGAVRDELLGRQPKDFDVFVCGRLFLEGEVETVTDGLEEVPLSEFHASEPFMVGQYRIGGFVHQVMSRPDVTSVEALLDTFDWNVSLFAYDGTSCSARCEVAHIAPGKELTTQHFHFPLSTLRRGFRFAERYGMNIRQTDLVELCRLVSVFGAEKPPVTP